MSTILVTGGTGFLGSRLVRRLVGKGYRVRVMAVANDPLAGNLDGAGCEIATGDITRPETLAAVLAGVGTVFHLAAVLYADDPELFRRINLDGTRHLVDACVGAGVPHFVYVSAAAADYRVRTSYGETKHLAEQLMSTARERTSFTVVRPTLVFGPGGGGQELVMYVRQLRRFRGFVPIVGRGNARKRWVCVDDVVEGLSLLVGATVSFGRIYNLGGGDAHTMRRYTELLCRRLGIGAPIVPVPVWLCRAAAAVLGVVQSRPLLKTDTIVGVTMDADVDIGPASRDLGYRPIGFEEWLLTRTAGDPFWDAR
jgi:nucleoside-diphosphate-sugar epimerase